MIFLLLWMHDPEEYSCIVGVTALIYAKAAAVLPAIALVPSVSMSTEWERQIIS